ncbi:MAG: fatty acyl-AMP ligase [Pyrinomonadaceae bacterium]
MQSYIPKNSQRATDTPKTLVAALERASETRERGFYFVGYGSQETFLSFQQIHAEALRRAAHLSALGLRKGDRLALVMAEGAEFVMNFFGVVMAGGVPVPISPPFTPKSGSSYIENVARIVETAGAKMLLTEDKIKHTVQMIRERGAAPERIITTEEAFLGVPPEFEPPDVQPDDLCFLQFTSGSTSLPKGVMVSHANLMANISAFMGPSGLGTGIEDVGVSWLPLFHDMGLIGFILGPLVWSNSVVIISTTAFARSPRIWLRAIHKYRGTVTYAPNFAYALAAKRLCDQDLENLDLSCLRVAGCGAEPIHAPNLRDFAERLRPTGFNAEAFVPSYGLAESTLAVTLHRRGVPLKTDKVDAELIKWRNAVPATSETKQVLEIVSCGVCVSEHHLAIVDEEGSVLPERQVGEITVKGPSIARGYFDSPEATGMAWKDGWLHTGDLGYIADGELFVCGRIKDLVIIRGANFYPHDIERAVCDLPGVKHGNIVAFGVTDEGQERLVVVAETDGRNNAALSKLIAERIREVIGLEVYRAVCVPSGTLFKTSSGKLRRHKVKQLFERGQLPSTNGHGSAALAHAPAASEEATGRHANVESVAPSPD